MAMRPTHMDFRNMLLIELVARRRLIHYVIDRDEMGIGFVAGHQR